MSSSHPLSASEAKEALLDATPSLDVLPDLIPDASPMSDPSQNPTPVQDSVGRSYFTSKADSKNPVQHELPFRPNITRSIIASQVQEQKKTSTYRPTTLDSLFLQDLNPTHQMFNSAPFAPSPEGPCFASPAQAFWYRKTSPHLSRLLESASYPPHLQAQYIDFFNHSIIPALGPTFSTEATWKPHLTHNHSPFEPSWNISGHDQVAPEQQVRFKFEPIRPLAGTNEDPFNQLVPNFFVSALAGTDTCPNLDLSLWHHFIGDLFVTSAESARMNEPSPLGYCPPTCYLALDLPSNEFAPTMKSYLFPHRRALLDGKTNTEVLLSAIKKLHSPAFPLLHAIEEVESFLATCKSDEHKSQPTHPSVDTTEMSLEMLSFDCVAPSQGPRIKLYLKTHNTSFSNIRHIYTLAGSRSGPQIDKGLRLFKQFWECLTGLEGEWRSFSAQTTPFLYFSLVITPGKEDVEVDIYVPAWTCGIEEQGVREGFRNFFLARGWEIGEELEKVGEALVHTYLSFAYDEMRGVSVTMCYSPFMDSVESGERAGS